MLEKPRSYTHQRTRVSKKGHTQTHTAPHAEGDGELGDARMQGINQEQGGAFKLS
jgi:hypothetical protein